MRLRCIVRTFIERMLKNKYLYEDNDIVLSRQTTAEKIVFRKNIKTVAVKLIGLKSCG